MIEGNNGIEELSETECDGVDGGLMKMSTALAITGGLMALGAGSVLVLTVGMVAGAFYVTGMALSPDPH
jgi:hypothetical protein